MTHAFRGLTADEAWRQAAGVLTRGDDPDILYQDSRLGFTREILHSTFVIEEPRQRWVLSREPAINPAFAIAEVFWILAGRQDAAFLNFWNPVLPKFAGYGATYHGAYGSRLRSNFGFDQLIRAYEVLKSNSVTRQVVLQIWDPRIDFPEPSGAARDPDIPCNICSMLKIRNGRLEWLQVMRANDIFLGTPHNLVQFTTLQEVMAGWLNVEPGRFVQQSDSLHCYEADIPKFYSSNRKENLRNLDNLSLQKEEFDEILERCINILDTISKRNASRADFDLVFSQIDNLPSGYRNLLLVCCADAARRNGFVDMQEYFTKENSNKCLDFLWSLWVSRQKKVKMLS